MTPDTFDRFDLSKDLHQALAKMNYITPTPIQAQAIPLAMKGRDILGSAQTGTGKTAAFSIPLIEAVLRDPQCNALVLTPTRELAKQVIGVIHGLLGAKTHIKTAFIIGGESMGRQLQQLRARPRIIVATPGRLNDHLQQGLRLDHTRFLVLDETDRMLDMGFSVQLDKIVKYLPDQRQTLMFSATLPKSILHLSQQYLRHPERVAVGQTNVVAPKIKQEIVHIPHEKKYPALVDQLGKREGSVIVFVKTKHGAERIAKKLADDDFETGALHGDLRQNKRALVMSRFRDGRFRILVATDIAARGLDVPHLAHVVNYDLPQVAEDYIHRMGRTARAGAEGSALCFISPDDKAKWRAIEKLLNPHADGEDEDDRRAVHKPRPQGNRPPGPRRRYGKRKEERAQSFSPDSRKRRKESRR